jgi:hypothetical protein
MRFDSVLVAFSTDSTPPQVRALKESRKDYFFAPLATEGSIYTIDRDLWLAVAGALASTEKAFCPGPQDIHRALERSRRSDCLFLMGLIERDHFTTPGTPSVKLALQQASAIVDDSESLQELGYDAIDELTGISGLANVGYSSGELEEVRRLRINMTRYNLIAEPADAESFCRLASSAAQEHAPFIPIRVVARLPPNHD